jgi:hypothetical protein
MGMLNKPPTESGEEVELRRVQCDVTDSLWKRVLRLMFPDQRKQDRMAMPPLVGYLGTARASKPYELGDISLTGFCLLTDERWIPGTEMPVTLLRMNMPAEDNRDSFTVQATVVRCDGEGVGFSIVLSEEESNAVHGNPLRVRWMTRREMEEFLECIKAEQYLPLAALDNVRSRSAAKAAGSPFKIGGQAAWTQTGSD